MWKFVVWYVEKYAVFRVCILWSGCGSDVIFHRVNSLILKIYFFLYISCLFYTVVTECGCAVVFSYRCILYMYYILRG